MKLDRKGMTIVAAVSLSAAVAAYCWWIYLPTRHQIAEVREKTDRQRQVIAQAGSVMASMAGVQQEIARTRAYNVEWERQAPALAELSGLFGRISDLSKADQATTTQFDPEPTVRHDKLSEVPVRIGLSGPFLQLFQFVGELERLSPAIWVESLRMTGTGKDRKDIAGSVELVIFANNSENSDYVKPAEHPIQ